jgi:hypothetical protein
MPKDKKNIPPIKIPDDNKIYRFVSIPNEDGSTSSTEEYQGRSRVMDRTRGRSRVRRGAIAEPIPLELSSIDELRDAVISRPNFHVLDLSNIDKDQLMEFLILLSDSDKENLSLQSRILTLPEDLDYDELCSALEQLSPIKEFNMTQILSNEEVSAVGKNFEIESINVLVKPLTHKEKIEKEREDVFKGPDPFAYL